MLNKRIVSVLVTGMVMASMVGCQSARGHVEYNDMRENPIESQYEDQDSKQTKGNKDLTVKEKREVNDSEKEANNQTKQNPKAPKRYNPITGEYVGRYTDEDWKIWVKLFNKALEEYGDYDHDGQIDAKDPNETNQEYLDRQQNKSEEDKAEYEKEYEPKDHTGEDEWDDNESYYDEDYWETDGDIPEEESNSNLPEQEPVQEQEPASQSNIESNIEASEPQVEE